MTRKELKIVSDVIDSACCHLEDVLNSGPEKEDLPRWKGRFNKAMKARQILDKEIASKAAQTHQP